MRFGLRSWPVPSPMALTGGSTSTSTFLASPGGDPECRRPGVARRARPSEAGFPRGRSDTTEFARAAANSRAGRSAE